MFRIVEDESPPIPEGFSPMLRNFLELCFNKDPDLRPSAAILFEHPWLKQKWAAYKVSNVCSDPMRALTSAIGASSPG